MSSISTILADTLDLIGNEDSQDTSKKQVASTRTASSILLEEKKRSKALLEELDFIPVSNTKEQRPTNAIFDQIAASTVDAPTYWKDAHKDKGGKAKPSVIAMPAGNKKKQEKIRKGEDYADRFSEKKASKNHRNGRVAISGRPY